MWLLANELSPNGIYRRSIKFLRELHRLKHCPFGLKGTETVQNEELFGLSNIYRQEAGRGNYTTANTDYLS